MSAISDLRAAAARADEAIGCSPSTPHVRVELDAFIALYKAAKALVAAEEPRERWVDAEGVTRLPRAMREELGVGNGAHIWFLRGPERWEAWQESELCEMLSATSHENACSGSNDPRQDGSRYK